MARGGGKLIAIALKPVPMPKLGDVPLRSEVVRDILITGQIPQGNSGRSDIRDGEKGSDSCVFIDGQGQQLYWQGLLYSCRVLWLRIRFRPSCRRALRRA
jgi:hypothetical protein